MLKKGECGRGEYAAKTEKNAKLFFLKNIIFFFLFCILTKNRKFPADEKSSVGQMFRF